MAIMYEKRVLGALQGWEAFAANPFVGTWKLISCDAYRRNGQVQPLYGPEPQGRLVYDADGNMSVQVTRADRPLFAAGQKRRGAPDELRAAYQGYEAYFSTYEVDEARGIVNHHVQGGLFPNWVGTNQARYFRFEGPNRLVLSTAPVGSAPTRQTIVTLVWERMA
jgi:hypothetical protein